MGQCDSKAPVSSFILYCLLLQKRTWRISVKWKHININIQKHTHTVFFFFFFTILSCFNKNRESFSNLCNSQENFSRRKYRYLVCIQKMYMKCTFIVHYRNQAIQKCIYVFLYICNKIPMQTIQSVYDTNIIILLKSINNIKLLFNTKITATNWAHSMCHALCYVWYEYDIIKN